jgi:hypothetical protein
LTVLVKAENAAAELKSGEVLLENTCFHSERRDVGFTKQLASLEYL